MTDEEYIGPFANGGLVPTYTSPNNVVQRYGVLLIDRSLPNRWDGRILLTFHGPHPTASVQFRGVEYNSSSLIVLWLKLWIASKVSMQ